MKISLYNTYKEVRKYVTLVKNNHDYKQLWEEEVIKPFWEELCEYAPFDLSQSKPKPITDIVTLCK